MKLQKALQQTLGLLLIVIIVAGCAQAAPAATAVQASPQATSLQPPPATITEATAEPTSTATSAKPPTPEPTAATSGVAPWSLVAVGDSIPFNSPDDCPGCTGFVDRYAAAITQATGHPVKVQNLSQHNGLQLDGLLEELKPGAERSVALANADIIVVGIGHNDTPWNRDDDPCDGKTADPDWSKYNASCATAAAEMFRPKFESLYSQIAALRAGKPTIFRTIDTYNDWVGDSNTPPEAADPTRMVLDEWDAMVCKAAQANGFACADIYHAFNGPDGRKPSLDLLAGDYTHPSDKGNALIATTLEALGYAPLASAAGGAMAAPTASGNSTSAGGSAAAQPAAAGAPVPVSTAVVQFVGHSDKLKQASFSPDGKQVVTASDDDTIRVWDAATGKQTRLIKIQGHVEGIRGAVFSPDDKQLLTASNDKLARTWDVVTGKELRQFAGHANEVTKALFSPDGKLVVTTSFDGTARVWDAATAQSLVVYKGHGSSAVYRAAFSPDGKKVVTSGADMTARIWDPLTGKELMVLSGHTGDVADAAFSTDGKWVVTASQDGTARIWDANSGKELRKLTVPGEEMYAAAFSPDGKYVATVGSGKLARLWDMETGQEVRDFSGNSYLGVRDTTFSSDGSFMLTAGEDGVARLYRLN